jgi:MoxR-like ATPase
VIRLVRREEQGAQGGGGGSEAPPVIPQQAVFDARAEIAALHVAEAMDRYMADLVQATRTPAALSEDLARWIEIGASPRGSLALDKCARAHAWLKGRDYVDPADVRAIVHDAFRHRIALTYEAQGDGVSIDKVIDEVVSLVALP